MGVPGNANPLLLVQAAGAAAGYEIERSVRFNSADSAYLNRTPASAGNRKTWTWAGWLKRCEIDQTQALFGNYTDGSNFSAIRISNNYIQFVDQGSGGTNPSINTPNLLRDLSAWYHIIVALDTTQSTPANRCKIYLNGIELTKSGTYPDQNANLRINTASLQQNLGAFTNTGGTGFNGYLADVHFIDGAALDPTDFGEFDDNGVWQPIEYAGSYGTNGFFLSFSDNSSASALGTDDSGNGNNWTVNNISVASGAGNDSLIDVPTNGTEEDTGVGGEVRGNYATLNAVAGNLTLTNGNLDSEGNFAAWRGNTATIGISSGKWYWEHTIQSVNSGNLYADFGVVPPTAKFSGGSTVGDLGYGWYARNGSKETFGTVTSTSSSGATTGAIVQVAIDLDDGKIWFAVNNTWIDSGNPSAGTNPAFSSLTGTFLPAVAMFDDGVVNTNFGQRPFAYSAPSGFKALCTANLDTPTIEDGSTAMDVVTYTGTGSALTPTSTLGFNPDLVWIKSRSAATDHALYDAVRGVEKRLESNNTDVEVTSDGGVTAFNSAGFSVGTLAQVNTSSATYAGWCWDAGSSTVSNTDGSITSSVRANPSAGFSIVSYTGVRPSAQTVGHGLNAAPGFAIFRNRNNAYSWVVYHSSLNPNSFIALDSSAAAISPTSIFNNTAPTSSVFTVGEANTTNENGGDHIALCWAPVEGYSAFGSYTGVGGTAPAPFIFCGFLPKFVLIKKTDSSSHWAINDGTRNTYNPASNALFPSQQNAEDSTRDIDLLSNGFAVTNTSTIYNSSGGTYVWAAFAKSPFKYARAR